MDPGWPANPAGSLVCILCKSAMPFINRNPERFFRHLLADHGTFFNLNLLLEMSLIQPHSLKEESSQHLKNDQDQPMHKIQSGNSTKRNNHLQSSTNQIDNIPASLTVENLKVHNSLEHFQPINPVAQLINSNHLDNIPASQPANNIQSKAQMPNSSVGGQPPISQNLQQPTVPSMYIPYESRPSTFLSQPFQSNPSETSFTMSLPPDFSNLDPISFVKQKAKRKVTRKEVVNKNNHPVLYLPDNPNRHLVPEDLQSLIISLNPTRGVKFTYSQRMNTQMMVDDFVLKKKKGPYLSRGGRVVNWKCINDSCNYTAVTWEGQIQDSSRQHNHPSQPELFFKKQARVKIKENMAQEIQQDEIESSNPVSNVVMDVVTETSPEMRNKLGSIDALKQAARRYNRKLHRDSHPTVQLVPVDEGSQHSTQLKKVDIDSHPAMVPIITHIDSKPVVQPITTHMLLDQAIGNTDIISNLQYGNYEVVGEFPADFQFSLDLSEQAGNITEMYSGILENEGIVITQQETVTEGKEQVTLEEEPNVVVNLDTTGLVIRDQENTEFSDKLIDNNNESFVMSLKDDVEELLESSPTKESMIVNDEINICL